MPSGQPSGRRRYAFRKRLAIVGVNPQKVSNKNLKENRLETFTKILSVAIGGAFGAVLRYLINISPLQNLLKPFPFPTFLINITGSFLIGFLLILLTDRFQINENLRLAIIVGCLGAFTTFSTFEMEIYNLIREKEFVIAFVYLFASVLIGFIGVCAGVWTASKLPFK
jgi:fluoride exporter